MSDTLLSTLHLSTYHILVMLRGTVIIPIHRHRKHSTIIIPISQMQKARLGEAKSLAQDHRAVEWQSKKANAAGILAGEPSPLTFAAARRGDSATHLTGRLAILIQALLRQEGCAYPLN